MTAPTLFSRPPTRRRWVLAIAALAIVGVGVAIFMMRGSATHEPPTPVVAFSPSVRAVNAASRAASTATLHAESAAIVKILDDFYQRAFVDPKLWGNGTFPELATAFSTEARASFKRDVAALTIGEGRLDLRRVDPTLERMNLTVYFDSASKARLAVAAVDFRARATTTAKNGAPVNISQRVTFYLQKDGAVWAIVAYDAAQDQASATSTPTPKSS